MISKVMVPPVLTIPLTNPERYLLAGGTVATCQGCHEAEGRCSFPIQNNEVKFGPL